MADDARRNPAQLQLAFLLNGSAWRKASGRVSVTTVIGKIAPHAIFPLATETVNGVNSGIFTICILSKIADGAIFYISSKWWSPAEGVAA